MTGNKDPVTTRDTVPKRGGCFSCRSASAAVLRQLGKTCELQLLGRFNRTCAAGLRHSVRPANCKRGPLPGFEVPNVGHPFPFLFLFPFSTFVVSESHFPFAQPEAFSNLQGRSAATFLSFLLLTFQFFDYALSLFPINRASVLYPGLRFIDPQRRESESDLWLNCARAKKNLKSLKAQVRRRRKKKTLKSL